MVDQNESITKSVAWRMDSLATLFVVFVLKTDIFMHGG